MSKARFLGIVRPNRSWATLVALFFCLSAMAQMTILPILVQDFTTDNLQNIYLLTPDNEIVKIDSKTQTQYRFANSSLGRPTVLDASIPFHFLLYYPDFQNVVTLDRTLSETGRYNLLALGFFQVNAVGMASDGKLWLYDEVNFKLKKIDQTGTAQVESSDLSLALGKTIRPNFLLEKEQQVFLNDPEEGILVFDVFGQYLKTLPIKGLHDFQVMEDELVYFQNGKLMSFHLQALLERPFALPDGAPMGQKMRLEKDKIFVLEGGVLTVFRF